MNPNIGKLNVFIETGSCSKFDINKIKKEKNIMKNQSTRKLEKDLLKLHTKDFTDKDKLTILHLILDGKIADAKDMLKPQGVPEKEIDNIIQEYKKSRFC